MAEKILSCTEIFHWLCFSGKQSGQNCFWLLVYWWPFEYARPHTVNISIYVTDTNAFMLATFFKSYNLTSTFLPFDATQSRARLCRLSVCPSVCDVQVSWSHIGWDTSIIILWLIMLNARADPNMDDLVNREHPQNYGGIEVGPWAQKPAISPKRCKIGPRLLWCTNRKSHTRFRLVPKSMTLDDLDRLKRTLAEKTFTEPTRKKIEWR